MKNIEFFNNILKSFKIGAECVAAHNSDNYFYYDIKLAPHTKVKLLQKYADEISLALQTPCKPSIKILHNLGIVRMEFVSKASRKLNLLDFFTNDNVPKGELNCLLGQTVDGNKVWMDIAKNPHMIIAGTTGSGKSVLMHNIIANLFNYHSVILHLIDPKQIEFHQYENKMPNVKVHYTYNDAIFALDSMLGLMDSRYDFIRRGGSVNELPYAVLMIDEFADLIMQDKEDQFYTKLCRLAQKCRAAKISIILSTQRPSANIINGTIKANFPARIACKVASHVDSKVILDSVGAENLLGQGDALLRDNFRSMERFQVAYVTSDEISRAFATAA